MSKIIQENDDLKHFLTKRDVSFRHHLAQTGMFDDHWLALLIDVCRQAGPEYYTLGSLDEDGFGEKWQTGVLGDMAGQNVLEAIKNGNLWLQLQGLEEIAPEYFALAEQGFAEIKAAKPDFNYHKLSCNILISSPSARVLCHLDCAEVILWHIRGRKRVYLYDLTRKEFASEETIERVILRETEEEIPYKQQWDAMASVYELEPGQAVNWPHFWPHRVDNIKGLNVSMQTEFYSNRGIRQYGVRFANGMLRRRVGAKNLATTTDSPFDLAKAGLGLMSKRLGIMKPAERKITSKFVIDPERLGAIKTLGRSGDELLEK